MVQAPESSCPTCPSKIGQVQRHHSFRHFLQVLNQKILDKKAELDDTISYYSQREAEYETKIDELMTRLQEQTTMYMKLQAEFESYEWYEDGEVPETTTGAVEGEGDEGPREGTMSRKSRESPMLRSRPPTRPPTRSDLEEVSDVFMFYVEQKPRSIQPIDASAI